MATGLKGVKADFFRHEALFYSGEDDFVEQASSFIRDSIEADEPVFVLVSQRKVDLLRDELDKAITGGVWFANMTEIGINPARIIPTWQEYLDERATDGRRCRGIGEPIWAGRDPEELIECQIHESLLNVAFDGPPAWWLLCPYDKEALRPEVIEEAYQSHPFVFERNGSKGNATFKGLSSPSGAFEFPLTKPPSLREEVVFSSEDLESVRHFVSGKATNWGLRFDRAEDLVLVANELATNSLKYGGGRGVLRMWRDVDAVICEVADHGTIDEPLVGRRRPTGDLEGGMGLWLANQLCDLVQVRSYADGTTVRVRLTI